MSTRLGRMAALIKKAKKAGEVTFVEYPDWAARLLAKKDDDWLSVVRYSVLGNRPPTAKEIADFTERVLKERREGEAVSAPATTWTREDPEPLDNVGLTLEVRNAVRRKDHYAPGEE